MLILSLSHDWQKKTFIHDICMDYIILNKVHLLGCTKIKTINKFDRVEFPQKEHEGYLYNLSY